MADIEREGAPDLPERDINTVLDDPHRLSQADEHRTLNADSDDRRWEEVVGKPLTRNPAISEIERPVEP